MAYEAGFRRARDEWADEPHPTSDPELVGRIRAEIRATGPITFARFMELALYDPDLGYYAGERRPPGRAGDFITGPELHPIFGWALARAVEAIWARLGEPRDFVIREPGAGAGALAIAILDGLRRSGSPLLPFLRYEPVEVTGAGLRLFRSALERAGFGAAVGDPSADPITGLIIANEVLDALPTHRVEGTQSGLVERFVAIAGDRFVEVAGEPSTPALAERLTADDVELGPGQVAEVCLAADSWLANVAAGLDRGVLIVIDYGDPAESLYDPRRRPAGTLRAYLRHRVHDDPFRHVGRQDLTAHVDVTSILRATAAAGLAPLGLTTQAEFLADLGAGELLAGLGRDPATRLEDYLTARSALVRLVDPAAMGRFRVMASGRRIAADPPLPGFRLSVGDRPRFG